MRWTYEPPTREGWYLWRRKKLNLERAYYVFRDVVKGRLYMGACRGSRGRLVKWDADAEWAGPLEMPEEADNADE